MSIEAMIVKHCDKLFDEKKNLHILWQEIAELVYPERADFTTVRHPGSEYSRGLMTSFPVLARRDLGNSFGAMLRPTAKDWFRLRSNRPDANTLEEKQWFGFASEFVRNAMNDRNSHFRRATTEGDHDFATFGQTVISIEINRERHGMLYRCWHLRDCAWMENTSGEISTIYRKWKPTVTDLMKLFPKTVHPRIAEKQVKDPYARIDVLHCIIPSDEYALMAECKKIPQPYISIYMDKENKHIMECVGSWTTHYIIPRWSTTSGSQYASSPATSTSLPDCRLIQEQARVLLESGEKAVNPPMIAVQEAIRSDVSVYAGGITWVDAEYDEKMGEVLRPMVQDQRGLSFGMEQIQDTRTQISDGFFLNKIALPPTDTSGNMTAYEVGQRVQEYIRHAMPLFEPMEEEYNGQLCETTLEILLRNSPVLLKSMPKTLSDSEYSFEFESPLHDAVEKIKVGQWMEAQQVLSGAVQIETSTRFIVDYGKAVRDTLGAVVPADWLRSEGDVADMAKKEAQQMQQQQILESMQQGANVAKTVKEASPTVGQGGYGGAAL